MGKITTGELQICFVSVLTSCINQTPLPDHDHDDWKDNFDDDYDDWKDNFDDHEDCKDYEDDDHDDCKEKADDMSHIICLWLKNSPFNQYNHHSDFINFLSRPN